MKRRGTNSKRRSETGAALLIAIFILLLISVVGIALILSSGSETALSSNYKTSTGAYYAALAGLEEGRGRLLFRNPGYLNLTVVPSFAPGIGQPPLSLDRVLYILNPANGEAVVPTDLANPATYPDTEYNSEFTAGLGAATVQTTNSLSPANGLAGPSYKWVRLTPATEKSLNLDVDGDGTKDDLTPLYFDPAHLSAPNAASPGLIASITPPATAAQVIEVTSLAVLPNGSRRMLQYVVAPLVISPNAADSGFPAALTLAGSNVQFQGPGTASFVINGQDTASCLGQNPAVAAIGYAKSGPPDGSGASILAAANPPANYRGAPLVPQPAPAPPAPTTPSIADVSAGMRPDWLTPSGLENVVQQISKSADAVVNGPATGGSFPAGMSPAHPMTIVINGDLNLTSWHGVGYGLLVVTGTLQYDPDANWEGAILVIGKGQFLSTLGGVGGIDGALFIAQTRDASGNILNTLGTPVFSQTAPGTNAGHGIRYNCNALQFSRGPIAYQVLTFREIPLLN